MENVSKEGLSGSIIKIDEGLVTNHLNELVLETIEQTLNGLLEVEADKRGTFSWSYDIDSRLP